MFGGKRMSLLKFYIILTVLGILIDILGLILSNNQASTEEVAFCLIIAILFLIIGIRGLIGKIKSYIE